MRSKVATVWLIGDYLAVFRRDGKGYHIRVLAPAVGETVDQCWTAGNTRDALEEAVSMCRRLHSTDNLTPTFLCTVCTDNT